VIEAKSWFLTISYELGGLKGVTAVKLWIRRGFKRIFTQAGQRVPPTYRACRACQMAAAGRPINVFSKDEEDEALAAYQ